MHQIVDRALDLLAQRLMVGLGAALGREDVVMQVAIAQMAETVDPERPQRRDPRQTFGDEGGQRLQRQQRGCGWHYWGRVAIVEGGG